MVWKMVNTSQVDNNFAMWLDAIYEWNNQICIVYRVSSNDFGIMGTCLICQPHRVD